jgi:hypothetical protein
VNVKAQRWNCYFENRRRYGSRQISKGLEAISKIENKHPREANYKL